MLELLAWCAISFCAGLFIGWYSYALLLEHTNRNAMELLAAAMAKRNEANVISKNDNIIYPSKFSKRG